MDGCKHAKVYQKNNPQDCNFLIVWKNKPISRLNFFALIFLNTWVQKV